MLLYEQSANISFLFLLSPPSFLIEAYFHYRGYFKSFFYGILDKPRTKYDSSTCTTLDIKGEAATL